MIVFTEEVTEELIEGLDEAGARVRSGASVSGFMSIAKRFGDTITGLGWSDEELCIIVEDGLGHFEDLLGHPGISAEEFLKTVKLAIYDNGGSEKIYQDRGLLSLKTMEEALNLIGALEEALDSIGDEDGE